MKYFTSMVFGLVMAFAPLAHADENPVVVELFTSQGCSSCPPADEMLARLAKRKDVIALGYHVDYWDYLGWKDEFSNPEYTRRQVQYNTTLHSKYRKVTPQAIVHGSGSFVGREFVSIQRAIEMQKSGIAPAKIAMARQGGKVVISVTPGDESLQGLEMNLVQYSPSETVSIKAGENRGRKINYVNIVTDLRTIHKWGRNGTIKLTEKADKSKPVVILIQHPRGGPIVSTALLK